MIAVALNIAQKSCPILFSASYRFEFAVLENRCWLGFATPVEALDSLNRWHEGQVRDSATNSLRARQALIHSAGAKS